MLNAASWTARLNELASAAGVPGATLGIWSDGQEILAAHGVLNTTTKVPVTTDSLFQVGQSSYLRIDPEAGVAVCLLTNSAESETLYRELFNEVFGALTGVTMPAPPRPADGSRGVIAAGELGRYAGRYERVSRRLEVSVRDGQLRMLLTMTGNLAAITGAEPEELILHPADSSGTRFVLRSADDEPWVPLSFGQFGDGTPYIYMSGRVTPRVG